MTAKDIITLNNDVLNKGKYTSFSVKGCVTAPPTQKKKGKEKIAHLQSADARERVRE